MSKQRVATAVITVRGAQSAQIEPGGHVAGAVQLFWWEFGGSAYPTGRRAQFHEQARVVQEMPTRGAVAGDSETNQHAVTTSEYLGEDQPTRPGLSDLRVGNRGRPAGGENPVERGVRGPAAGIIKAS